MLRYVLAVMLALCAAPALAQTAQPEIPGHLSTTGCPGSIVPCFVPAQSWQPVGFQQILAFSGLQTLTVPTGATWAIIRAETNNIRWRDDGVSPTASVGQFMVTTDQPFIYTGSLSTFSVIPVTGSATLDIAYYR